MTPSITHDARSLGEELAHETYLRNRRTPRWRDGDYLCLCDLNRLVHAELGNVRGDVFDYGCGGAPYSSLFEKCRCYVKADVLPGPLVDRLLGSDGMTREMDASYDWVVSTQVLEHVPDPRAYLRECFRILRPGGELFLTTHGFYPEHGCPFDYHRWTAEGLVREAIAAGFDNVRGGRLTTGVRGAVQILHHCVWNLRVASDRPAWGLVLGCLRKLYAWIALPVLNALADRFPEQRQAPVTWSTSLYVGVFLRARRPLN